MTRYTGTNPRLQQLAEELRAQFRKAELERRRMAGITPVAGPFLLPPATLAEVRGSVARQLAQFLRHRLDEAPPRIMVTGPPGSGKTEEIIASIPAMVAADKHQGRPHRVIVAVPMHRLGRQIIDRFASRFRQAGITTAVYEGRGVSRRETEGLGEDASSASDGRVPMCRNPLDVELALKACADVTQAVCGTTKEAKDIRLPTCRYRHDCKYWSQLGECSKADVVFLAHNFLFDEITDHTKTVFAEVGTIIVDEDPSTHGDGTVQLAMSDFGDSALRQDPVLHTKGTKAKPNPNCGKPDYAKTEELRPHFTALQSALHQVGQRVPLHDALAAEGLTRKLLKQVRALNWRRKVDPAMWPDMPYDQREEAADRARINPVLSRMHALFCACMEAAPPDDDGADADRTRDALDPADPSNPADPDADHADTASERVEVNDRGGITFYRLRPIADWVDARPVLVASATPRTALDKIFPGLQHSPAPRPAAPFQTVHQHLGAFGQHAVEQKLPELLPELKAIIAGRRALVITHKRVAKATAEALPGVAVRYHGGTVGDDDFGDIEVEIVIGGAFPKAKDVRRLASAEAGRILPFIKPVQTSAIALLAGGTGARFDRLAYADPAAQAVHAGIYDASIIQAIGRARGLNRTVVDPVEIHVLGNCPLPLPITSIARHRRPSRLAKMLWRGLVPLSAAGMARRYPELFSSAVAARTAKHRWGGEAAILDALRADAGRMPWPSAIVTLQLAGQGQKRTRLIVDRDRVDELRREAIAEFGGLVSWHVESFSPGIRPAATRERTVTVPGKEPALFPGMSQSFCPPPPPGPPISTSVEARAAPD